jgi:hypothetical protein
MRRIVEHLSAAEGSTLTRAQLEDELVPLGFRSDNILRAVRSLERFHICRLEEGRFAETSRVRLFRPVEEPMSDAEIFAVLEGMR